MKILEFTASLHEKIKSDLLDHTQGDELPRLGKTILATARHLRELKEFTRTYRFSDATEEIQFFKEAKPVLLSHYYYHKDLFALRQWEAFSAPEKSRSHYQRLLRTMQAYTERHKLFHLYCLSGATYLDEFYFRRRPHHEENIHADEQFSTDYDRKLARILANEMLRTNLRQLLRNDPDADPATAALTWTGSKTDLIELIYALHYAEPFNKGTASIKLLASTFEKIFHVTLGDYYRTFQDIRLRKKSQAPFLELLRDKFITHLNDFT